MMKPGLRKVVALILASVTLFGSGASAVSAAYADDTTMGTSTRIQAEPDKTTTGGDEAGTGADKQSDTGTPAQSAPQADAGQAAPDVTIHDMLDTDSAAVSRLRLTDRITGTAPFDKDNERGDDKDETNDIVRSYDTVTYDYEYTLTPDSTMDYYRRTRVGFRFELPYPKDKVTFDAEKMGWVDHTPGYEPKLTTETIDGTVTQVYTCYRLLEPTSQSPTVNPGTGSIGLSVAVKGAPHGYRFHPTVKAWPAWDASNPTNTGTHKRAEDTPKDVTVSAKLNLNVRMVDYGNVDRGVFDFSSGAANAPNRTEGKVTGLGLGVALVTEMRWPDRTKGLKGLEAPSGRITYRLRLSNQYSDDTKTGTKHPMERRWQPLLYDYGHIDNMDSKYGRTFAWMGDLQYRAPGVADRADGYDRVARGDTTVTTTTGERGTDVTVSFDGYDTSVLPIHNKFNGTQNKCSTDYMTSDCSTMQVGAIHTDVLQFVTPTSRDGRTVAQYYGNVDQTANITMDDMGLTATGVSGDRLATAEDNSNQASTGDDHAGSAMTVRMPGTYSTRIRYTCWNNDSSWNDAGTSCDWTQPDYNNGSDSLIQGSKLRLQIGHNIIIQSEGDAEVMGMGLVKLDPNSIEPVDDHPDTQPIIPMNVFTWGMRAAKRRNQIPYWYAVKKDGTNWKDYREQRDTKISGLDYYPTLNEAKTHGTIVGMLFEDHNTVDPTGTSFNRTFTPIVSLPARILDTARIGTVTPIVTTTDGGQYTTDYIITDTLPKGLAYVDGSMTVGGQYSQHTPDKGTVTGGTPVTPTIVVNKDGTTTMTIRVNGARADSGTQTVIHYSTTIGDASDPDHDVRNNDSFTNHATIQSKRNMAPPLAPKAQIAGATIRVSRTRASALATRADPLLNDINRPLGYTNMLGNFSKDEKTDPYAVDVMPYRGLNQSNYHGDYALTGLTVKAGAGASMNGVRVYFTTDQKWRNVDATKITREQVQQWTEATVNATTGKVTIPDGYSKPVAWAFTSPSLPANARYDFILSIKPTGNSASDMYVNRWADGDNKVDAVTQVVERKVNGVAWFDTNHDGIRQDSDRLLADVNVTLVDANGRTVTSVDGKPCTATTDRNGHYEIGSIPAGSGFKLRFTPKTGTAWHGQNVTVKNAKEASEATDSDSDQENDSHGDMVAGVITLKPFPALDEMTSAVYEDPNEDHGMSGTLMLATPATFKAVKVLDGRPNGAWTDRDRYVADITALDGAPANAVPSTITFADNRTQTLQINSNAFAKEGVYRYQVRERKGDNAGVAYDSRTWILTVTVADDFDTFTRRITANTTCDGVQSDTIQFTNTYKAKPVSVQFRARKTLADPDHTGIQLQAGQYEFTCVEDKTGGQVGTAKTNDQRGDVLFDAISYTRPGTYDYTIRETPGDRGGVTYDTTKHHVRVTVTDDGEGQLLADVKYDGGTAIPEFTNTYRAQPATDTPDAVKAITASEGNHYKLKGDDFTFTLHRVTAPDGVTAEADQTKANDAQGNIRFDQLSFPLPGTYVYTVSERDVTVPGVTKDGTVTTITYTVKDVGHAGRLKIVDKTITRSDGKTANGIRFDNTYNPKGVGCTLGGVKTIINADTATNRIPQDSEFTFKLASHDGAPMPEGSKDGVKTVTNTGTGFTFGRMDYDKPGTYVYTVTEQAGRDPTIGYSTQAYDVTVTVTDQGGMLSASADRQATDVRFDNTYTPTPVDVTVKADKHLAGRDLNDGEFAAELKDSDGNLLQTKRFARVPRDAQSDKATDVREGEGTLEFDKLTFDRAGVYTYTVTEQDGDLGGVTYDRTVHTVTVTVTEDAKTHRLVAAVSYSDGEGGEEGILFRNTYRPGNVMVELTARKRLTGRELKTHEFEFELVDKTGKVIDTERNDRDGGIRFKPLTYGRDNNGIDDCGEHRYVIRERNTGEKNVTYDRTEHHVTVTVSDNLQGNLTAKVEYDPTDGKTKDSSATPTDKADKTDKTTGDAVGDKPSTTPGMVTVTGTRPEFTNSYIPPATPAIVKTIRQLAKTGVSAPTVALAAFTLLGVGLMLFRRRGNQTETARHRK